MSLFRSLVEKIAPPASTKFFAQLKELSIEIHGGSQLLADAVKTKTLGTPEFTRSLHALENKADAIADRFLLSIRHTMIHPVDPDDLRDIANGLDNIMDTMDHVAWRVEAYRLPPSDFVKEMVDVICQMTQELTVIFDLLISSRPAEIDAKFQSLSELEKQGDSIFHSSVKQLHSRGERGYTVEDEILSILEDCSDQCKRVGQLVVVMLERNR